MPSRRRRSKGRGSGDLTQAVALALHPENEDQVLSNNHFRAFDHVLEIEPGSQRIPHAHHCGFFPSLAGNPLVVGRCGVEGKTHCESLLKIFQHYASVVLQLSKLSTVAFMRGRTPETGRGTSGGEREKNTWGWTAPVLLSHTSIHALHSAERIRMNTGEDS